MLELHWRGNFLYGFDFYDVDFTRLGDRCHHDRYLPLLILKALVFLSLDSIHILFHRLLLLLEHRLALGLKLLLLLRKSCLDLRLNLREDLGLPSVLSLEPLLLLGLVEITE